MTTQQQQEVSANLASIDLLSRALRSLDASITATSTNEKFIAAHLAALRAAAALLATHAQPNSRRPTSVWVLLAKRAPEFAEWANFFAAGAGKRVAAEAGLAGAVTAREADDLVREAHQFIDLVSDALGLSRQLTLSQDVVTPKSLSNNVITLKPQSSKRIK